MRTRGIEGAPPSPAAGTASSSVSAGPAGGISESAGGCVRGAGARCAGAGGEVVGSSRCRFFKGTMRTFGPLAVTASPASPDAHGSHVGATAFGSVALGAWAAAGAVHGCRDQPPESAGALSCTPLASRSVLASPLLMVVRVSGRSCLAREGAAKVTSGLGGRLDWTQQTNPQHRANRRSSSRTSGELQPHWSRGREDIRKARSRTEQVRLLCLCR